MKKARKCTPVYDKGSNSDKGREMDKSVYAMGTTYMLSWQTYIWRNSKEIKDLNSEDDI